MTLALAYAERFPERVTEMILLSITMTRRADVHWLAHETGRFFPERVGAVPRRRARGRAGATSSRPTTGCSTAPRTPRSASRPSRDWTAWEDAILSLEEGYAVPHPRWADERYRIAFARLVTHYFAHAAWLEEDELLRERHRLAGIPGVLLHGRLDLSGPPDVAWQLARAWPGAELTFIPGGHTGDEEMDRLLLEATARFAGG